MSNPNIKIEKTELLSANWYKLKKVTFQIKSKGGEWLSQSRECYDRGNGATILLYNTGKRTVILTKQFRMPTYINGNETGMLIEACAGLLDEDGPEEAIKRETEEETGYKVSKPQKLFELYMSPGSVTEILYFFIAEYSDEQKVSEGGGVDAHEDIDVLEIEIEKALEMVRTGEIRDAKTVILLQHLKLQNLL